MSSHIGNVLKQALATFANKGTQKHEAFQKNLEVLISLLDKTTAEHVNFPMRYMNPQLWERPEKAPVSCIEIFEDTHVTMGIFILKPNGKLPLHNHPKMHGLIKVLAGKVEIISYSINTEKTKEIDQKSLIDEMPLNPKPRKHNIVTAELNEVTIATSDSLPCLLDPNFKNIHEIHSLDGPAAFLDVLAPPYDFPISEFEIRKCSYYHKLSQVTTNIFRLQEVKSPSWYWTDSCPYTGPELFDIELH
ncbi:unnamed protein product [Ceutorhynchus assimilis]|uniref:2-aminoethanethiol dioxygenase n=1 Tax=Ceutorhynchus assimilis TaxID=467358 RepID=A0A9N9MBG9_9CUCU|nr:unnamed protein product [Ceutorhynchus assimilis]